MGRGKDQQPIVSAVLPTGELVELLYDSETPASALLVSSDGDMREVGSLRLPDGRTLVPYAPRNNLLTHKVVVLPSANEDYTSEVELLAEIQEFIHRYVDVRPAFEQIASAYVLFSWVYDQFNELPYLRVRGDYGCGKSRFLLTVGSLCYKPIFASGASTVSPLFRLLDSIAGTLVIDEGDFRVSDEKAEVVKILNNGNARGFPVLRSEATPSKEFNPTAFSVFGPKIVATRGHFDDRALESRCLTEEMGGRPLRPDIPLNLPASFDVEALELRNKLLSFRFRTFGSHVIAPGMLDASLEPRIRQMFLPLLSTVGSPEARAELLRLAESFSGSIAEDRSYSTEAQVLEAIASLRSSGAALTVKAIANAYAGKFGHDGAPVTPRWIGSILRRKLFLSPVKRNGTFTLSHADLGKLEHLFERYGIVEKG